MFRPAQREVVNLYYQAGRSYREIADEQGVAVGTVMSRLHRAKTALREALAGLEETDMDEPNDLSRRFRLELELMDALKQEVDAAGGNIHRAAPEPMLRLRQMVETHPPRLLDLLRVSDSEERLEHLAFVVRSTLGAAMPVLASCCLSSDVDLRERALRTMEFWLVRVIPHYSVLGTDLFLDTLIASPTDVEGKVDVLLRLIRTVKAQGLSQGGHHVMAELTRVLLGYPEAAFPVLWEAFWELDEDDRVEYGVRVALAHLVEPLSDAAIEVFREGDAQRSLRLLDELMVVPRQPYTSPFKAAFTTLPERVYPVLKALAESEDETVRNRALDVCRRWRVPGVKARLTHEELIARLEDPDPGVRVRALNEMGMRAVVSARNAILERVEDDDPSVRETAVRAYRKVATDAEKRACLERIARSGDRRLMKVAARALYVGAGPRERTELATRRIERIRGDAEPEKHIDPILGLRTLPEIREYDEEELTRIVATVCGDYATTRRQMVMEGRHSLMRRERGVYAFTQIGEAVWRVGRFAETAGRRLMG